MSRFKPLSPEDMSDAQRRAYEDIRSGPRGSGAYGPFDAWLDSPGFTDRAQKLGAYLRFETVLSPRLKELAVLLVARRWTAQFEWFAHKKFAINGGLSVAVIDAIEARRRPDFVNIDEAAVYDFCEELLGTHNVGDTRFEAAEKHLGRDGVVDLVGVLGFYTLVSATLNVFEVPMPEGESPPLKD